MEVHNIEPDLCHSPFDQLLVGTKFFHFKNNISFSFQKIESRSIKCHKFSLYTSTLLPNLGKNLRCGILVEFCCFPPQNLLEGGLGSLQSLSWVVTQSILSGLGGGGVKEVVPIENFEWSSSQDGGYRDRRGDWFRENETCASPVVKTHFLSACVKMTSQLQQRVRTRTV